MNKSDISAQHAAIRQSIIELQEDVYDEKEVRKNQLHISLRIGNLSGILLVHLNYEDLYIYPNLLQHQDQEIREISQKFQIEMGNLSTEFVNYQTEYLRNPQALKEKTQKFIADTEKILYKISKRVEKEEFELYPMLE